MTYPHTFRTEHTETITTSSSYGAFYSRQKVPHVSIAKDVVPLLYYVDNNRDEFIENLKKFVEVKNIAGVFEHRHDMMTMVQMVEKWMKKLQIKYECFDVGWHEMSQACCKMPSVILGSTPNSSKKKKTLLIYSHLDIPNPNTEKWKTNPFELTEENKRMYGAGTSYGKGVLLCWFHAIEAYQNCNLDIPINIKFVVESMHERKNAGLEKLLNSKKCTFLASVDYIVVNESEWLSLKTPCLSYGAVGLCRFEVVVEKSGESDPKADMKEIFEQICDKNENILIEGIGDCVVQITPEEELIYDRIDYNFAEIQPTLPPHQQHLDKLMLLMKFWRLPSITVGDIEECCCDKPNTDVFKRKFTIKIVPLQLPELVCEKVIKHVYNVCSNMNCKSKVECEMVSGSRPWIEDFTSKNYEAARRATVQIYKENPNLIREDREIPIILLLQRVLERSILLLPLATGNCHAGRPNENISRHNFFEGTKLLIAYLYQIGTITNWKR